MSKAFSHDKFITLRRVLSHPADSFYAVRHYERGSIYMALICVVLFSFCFTINRIFASFIVNNTNPRTVDGLMELSGVFLLYLLFCIGNWSVTCLMNGEGRFKDIIIITGYSLLPLIMLYIPATILSRVLVSGEEAFYYIITGFSVIWTVVLILMGVMIIHNYTLVKTIITLLLTFIAMLLIIFIILLLYDLLNQVYGFLYSVYTELSFRY